MLHVVLNVVSTLLLLIVMMIFGLNDDDGVCGDHG